MADVKNSLAACVPDDRVPEKSTVRRFGSPQLGVTVTRPYAASPLAEFAPGDDAYSAASPFGSTFQMEVVCC